MSTEPRLPAAFGRYQVVEELGAGAMGIVYLCVDARLARPVAVKVLRENEALSLREREPSRARFRQEAEAAGRLSHPHIVQIYDVGPSYLVMEFLEGRPLSAAVEAGGPSTVREACVLVGRVAEALDYAHRHGIVHRDVKPANIMLTADGGVKVMDFGVARLDSSNLTVAGSVVGSVRYMAPEQMLGQRVDGRADVFSLAAVAYELLTGAPPFPGHTITEVIARVVQGNHVPPARVDARLPEGIAAVFAAAFAVRPQERTQGTVEFARALQEAARPAYDLRLARGAAGETPTLALAPTQAPELAATRAAVGATVLMVDSDPVGARVVLDGTPVGATPLDAAAGLGRHQVRLEAPGRAPVTLEVQLEGGRPLAAVSATLPDAAAVGELEETVVPDVLPRRLAGTLPAWPAEADAPGLRAGTAAVDAVVGEDGGVREARIAESAGPALDRALLAAVASWRFEPGRRAGEPVAVRLTVRHAFHRP
jgi:TonB family protein